MLPKQKSFPMSEHQGSDDKVKLAPPIKFSLEEALEYIQKDEYVEVTPSSLRLRKVFLDENERKRQKA
jgi:GTP-binding protein